MGYVTVFMLSSPILQYLMASITNLTQTIGSMIDDTVCPNFFVEKLESISKVFMIIPAFLFICSQLGLIFILVFLIRIMKVANINRC